jgi:hypothetical protein
MAKPWLIRGVILRAFAHAPPVPVLAATGGTRGAATCASRAPQTPGAAKPHAGQRGMGPAIGKTGTVASFGPS